jgi:enamine deaminase RidA (YjgF/YER057c/UK114 family)
VRAASRGDAWLPEGSRVALGWYFAFSGFAHMQMRMKKVSPSHFPKARGYSNGVIAEGRTLYISGQIAWDGDARIVSTDFATQFLQTLDNVISVVRAAGGGTEHIVKLLAFVTDLEEYRSAQKQIGEGWRERMGKAYPAMSLVKVAGLLEPGAKVEIEGIAALPS